MSDDAEAQQAAVLAVARLMGQPAFLAALLELVARGEVHSHAGGITLIFHDDR